MVHAVTIVNEYSRIQNTVYSGVYKSDELLPNHKLTLLMKLYQILIGIVTAQPLGTLLRDKRGLFDSNRFEIMFVQQSPSASQQRPSFEYQIGKWLAEHGPINRPGIAFAKSLMAAIKTPNRYRRINAMQKRRLGLFLKRG